MSVCRHLGYKHHLTVFYMGHGWLVGVSHLWRKTFLPELLAQEGRREVKEPVIVTFVILSGSLELGETWRETGRMWM